MRGASRRPGISRPRREAGTPRCLMPCQLLNSTESSMRSRTYYKNLHVWRLRPCSFRDRTHWALSAGKENVAEEVCGVPEQGRQSNRSGIHRVMPCRHFNSTESSIRSCGTLFSQLKFVSLPSSASTVIVVKSDRTRGSRSIIQLRLYLTDRRPRASQLAYGQSPRCSTERPATPQ